MEIVLQWLDELDDLVFAGFSIWSRLRRFCLAVALTAAAGLHALPLFGFAVDDKFALIEISLVSLAAWAIVSTLSARADLSGQKTPVNA